MKKCPWTIMVVILVLSGATTVDTRSANAQSGASASDQKTVYVGAEFWSGWSNHEILASMINGTFQGSSSDGYFRIMFMGYVKLFSDRCPQHLPEDAKVMKQSFTRTQGGTVVDSQVDYVSADRRLAPHYEEYFDAQKATGLQAMLQGMRTNDGAFRLLRDPPTLLPKLLDQVACDGIEIWQLGENLLRIAEDRPQLSPAKVDTDKPLREKETESARIALANHGISWELPGDWEKIKRGYGEAVYDVDGGKVQVIVTLKQERIADLLPYVNLWLMRDDKPEVPSLAAAPLESFVVAGREAVLVSLEQADHAVIHNGSQTWIFTMYGYVEGMIEHRKSFRSFVDSVAFEEGVAGQREVQERPESESETRSGRRRRGGG